MEILEIEPDIQDTKNAVVLQHVEGNVMFDHVSFRYNEQTPYVLNNINLDVKPGEYIAFVGSSGVGKTTICSLIPRFYEATKGNVLIDGINVKEIKQQSLRENIGIVQQDVYLFTGTIMDNIRYGKLDASDEEVIEAAKLANADSFIRRLPNGYQTMLSSDGTNLSQGQRQLLAIARAAICNPPVLILDEATSSIDTRTELQIQKAFDEMMKGRTTFIVAHRLSTIKNADQIIVMDQGHIVEIGNHEELLVTNKIYQDIHYSQHQKVVADEG